MQYACLTRKNIVMQYLIPKAKIKRTSHNKEIKTILSIIFHMSVFISYKTFHLAKYFLCFIASYFLYCPRFSTLFSFANVVFYCILSKSSKKSLFKLKTTLCIIVMLFNQMIFLFVGTSRNMFKVKLQPQREMCPYKIYKGNFF